MLLKLINKKTWIFYLLFAVILTTIWFKDGDILAAGEFGLSFYNLNQLASISVQAWGNQVLGGSSGYTVASGPTFFLLSSIQNLGMPGFFIQALFFGFSIFLALFSMDYLMKTSFANASLRVRIFASFFYLLNLYSMMNIWNRFLPNTILFYSILPLFLGLYIKGINLRRYYFAVWISLLSALLAYAFNGPAQTALYWLLIILYTVYYYFWIKKDLYLVRYFGTHIFTWFIFNFWWVSQSLYYRSSSTYKDLASLFFTDLGNQFTLDALSQSLGRFTNLFLLKHGTFFTENSKGLPYQWSSFYSHPIALGIEWLVVLSILFFAIKKVNLPWVKFYLFLFIFGVFVSKGNGDPFGEIFSFLFNNVPILQFYRNPFEKLELIAALSFSILFGLLSVELISSVRKKSLYISKIVEFSLFIYIFIFLGFPYYTSLVFSSGNPPANNPSINYRVSVPDYYKKADNFFKNQNELFRFISFPIGGEGIFYKWNVGYSGIEPSGIIFTTPNISYNTTIPLFNTIAESLERQFLREADFYKIASLLNVKYLVLRSDVDYKVGKMRDPEIIKNRMFELSSDSNSNLQKTEEFGQLQVFTFNEEVFLPKIYPAGRIINTSKNGKLEDIFLAKNYKEAVIVSGANSEKSLNSEFVEAIVVHPEQHFRFSGPDVYPYTEDPSVLPYSGRISTNALYDFVYFRDLINVSSHKDINSQSFSRIMFLGKRITETQAALLINDVAAVEKSLRNYRDYLNNSQNFFSSLSSDNGIGPSWRSNLLTALGSHSSYLSKIESFLPENHPSRFPINETKQMIIEFLTKSKIMPIMVIEESDSFKVENRQIYQFDIKVEGDYKLEFKLSNLDEYFEIPSEVLLQVDEQLISKQVVYKDGVLSLGTFSLKKGMHEIGFNLFNKKNLVDQPEKLLLEAIDSTTDYRIKINNLDPFTKYVVSFNYLITSGSPPKILWSQNIDSEIDLNFVPIYEKYLPKDDYYNGVRNYQVEISPSTSSDFAELVFKTALWNDCERQFGGAASRCNDPMFYKQFNRQSSIQIMDLKVNRSFMPDPYLYKINNINILQSLPKTSFNKVSQTRYEVEVRDAQEDYILVFSDLFNSDWSVKILGDEASEPEHILVNGYANGWWIDKKGDYKIIVEFLPQKYLNYGYMISAVSSLLGFIFILISRFKYEKNN